MSSRAQRRHHYQRMIVKRTKQDARFGVGALNEVQWRFKHARVCARTGALCSCSMCGNPRRHYGNSQSVLTRQELHSNLTWREDA
ncbi:hypothetical protein LUCX_166 [Xanthomonas phage vB_XciM_LucasX]|nr:hypothetical protein LUCX_166 [Xanthomonas phage vB_XciM_LucasX]